MTVAEKFVSLDEIIGYKSNEGYKWCDLHMTSRCNECGSQRYATIVAETFASKRSDGQYKDLLESMRRQGFKGAVLVNLDGSQLMNGHHRIAAAAELGIVDIPVTTNYGVSDDARMWPEDSVRNPSYRTKLWKDKRAKRIANGERVATNTDEAQWEYQQTGNVPEGFRKCSCCDVMYVN